MQKPDVSIIVSVLNGMPFLTAALASVPRACSRIELIVVDAGSSDESLQLAEGRQDAKVYSRPGLPLYAAWNFGVSVAAGRYIVFLNADDVMMPAEMLSAIGSGGSDSGSDDSDVVCFGAEAYLGDKSLRVPKFRFDGPLAQPSIDVLVYGTPAINAKLIRRELFLKMGGMDESYRLAADRDFLLRCLARGSEVRWRIVDRIAYKYLMHDRSMTMGGGWARRLAIAEEHVALGTRWLQQPALLPRLHAALSGLVFYEHIFAAISAVVLGRWSRAAWHGWQAMRRVVVTEARVLRVMSVRPRLRMQAIRRARDALVS